MRFQFLYAAYRWACEELSELAYRIYNRYRIMRLYLLRKRIMLLGYAQKRKDDNYLMWAIWKGRDGDFCDISRIVREFMKANRLSPFHFKKWLADYGFSSGLLNVYVMRFSAGQDMTINKHEKLYLYDLDKCESSYQNGEIMSYLQVPDIDSIIYTPDGASLAEDPYIRPASPLAAVHVTNSHHSSERTIMPTYNTFTEMITEDKEIFYLLPPD